MQCCPVHALQHAKPETSFNSLGESFQNGGKHKICKELSSSEIEKLLEDSVPNNIKRATEYGMKLFYGEQNNILNIFIVKAFL